MHPSYKNYKAFFSIRNGFRGAWFQLIFFHLNDVDIIVKWTEIGKLIFFFFLVTNAHLMSPCAVAVNPIVLTTHL